MAKNTGFNPYVGAPPRTKRDSMDLATLNIDELEIGPKLDAIVAEHVMGWRWLNYRWYDGSTKQLLWPTDTENMPHGDDFPTLEDGRLTPWNIGYSEDIAGAFNVLKHLAEQGYGWQLYYDVGEQYTPGYKCRIYHEDDSSKCGIARATTPELAICKAALKTAMVIKEKRQTL